jgi:prephenate dehydrogenase
MQKLGIVGMGDFGKMMQQHLTHYFTVEIFRREDLRALEASDEEVQKRLQELDYLVIAVTLDGFEDVCQTLSSKLQINTVVFDVCSVKVRPVQLMQKYFPNNQIIATHPVFGPQSAKAGLENLKIVIENISANQETYQNVKNFLQDTLLLQVVEMSKEEHDHQMAYVQGLSHFIAQALERMDIPDSPVATYSYRQLLKLRELIGKDSFELFKTIENGNSETLRIRQKFLANLNELENLLQKDGKGDVL